MGILLAQASKQDCQLPKPGGPKQLCLRQRSIVAENKGIEFFVFQNA